MATKTLTTYTCDGCGQEKARKDLRRFTLTETNLGHELVASAKTDLCTVCERTLHVKALDLWPIDEAEKLRGIVRG